VTQLGILSHRCASGALKGLERPALKMYDYVSIGVGAGRPTKMLSVSFRIDFGPQCAIGPGKIALLEQIRQSGSLSEAARTLRMSYRRAWLLLEDLNTSFAEPVAQMSVGGRGGGGAHLTPFGTELARAYRALESHILRRAQKAFPASAMPAAGRAAAGPGRPVPKRSVKRLLAGRPTGARRPGRGD